MIGLILGETQLGTLIIKKLKSIKKDFIIIDISKKRKFKNNKNYYPLSIGQLGKAISILKRNKCKSIIFAGRVIRPNFLTDKFDLKALYYLPKIVKNARKGDAFLLKKIIEIFKNEGFKILNSTYFNKELLLKKGNHTLLKPNVLNKKDILKGKYILDDLSRKNVAQSIVVRNGQVICIEDIQGTDHMLNKVNNLIKKFHKKRKKEGILLKLPKKNQDLRIDLPTLGIKTIKKCVKIGLKGIVVKANQNIFLDQLKCINLANKSKMFICAI